MLTEPMTSTPKDPAMIKFDTMEKYIIDRAPELAPPAPLMMPRMLRAA